ncbi:MAG: Rpn family recombination-promoting nuclease/putative transposase [Muribaculaceae bacterium]|nr:Rpn family recombination-promoting nuclease/putative transposase [Muribaculaceae bacterium]
MKDFISPLSDFGFNYQFGREQSKDNLIDLLNAILHERLDFEKIVDLTLNPTENKGISPEHKTTRYDIHCVTEKGQRIIVEMQNQNHPNFNNRMLYYGVEAIHRQDRRMDNMNSWDFSIDPVVTIALCNFNQKEFGKRQLIHYTFRDEETNERFGNQLSLVFLQLPQFPDREEECDTFLKQIIYSMKNMERIQTLESIPFSKEATDIFARMAKRSRYSALSEDEQLAFDRWLKFENDRLLEIAYARKEAIEKGLEEGRAEGKAAGIAEGREEGRAVGIAEGRAEGRVEEKWEMAKNLLNLGVDLETVSKASGLSIQDLRKL